MIKFVYRQAGELRDRPPLCSDLQCDQGLSSGLVDLGILMAPASRMMLMECLEVSAPRQKAFRSAPRLTAVAGLRLSLILLLAYGRTAPPMLCSSERFGISWISCLPLHKSVRFAEGMSGVMPRPTAAVAHFQSSSKCEKQQCSSGEIRQR